MSDGELLRIASEFASLTLEAQSALQNELRRRNLEHEQLRLPEPAPQTWGLRQQRRLLTVLKSLAFVLGHNLVAGIGVPVTVALFFYSIEILLETLAPSLARHNALLMIPFFPLQTFAGALNGFVLARRRGAFWKSRSAEMAWVLPAVSLAVGLSSYGAVSILSETRWQHFFWSALIRSRAAQMGTTLPFLTAIGYSIGHYFSRKTERKVVDVPTSWL
jgi:hypothetical protein